jgi:hypothetical protein
MAFSFGVGGPGPAAGYQLAFVKIDGSTNMNTFSLHFNQLLNCIPGAQSATSGDSDNQGLSRFEIPVRAIQGNPPMLVADFRSMLNVSQYPTIIIEMDTNELERLRMGDQGRKINFSITMNGIRRYYSGSGTVNKYGEEGSASLTGQISILLSDFSLEPPRKMLGIIKVKDEVNISFKVIFTDNF